MKLSEAFAWYALRVIEGRGYTEKTFKNYLSTIRSFISCIGDVEIEHIGIDYFIRWRRDMQKRGKTQNTIATDVGRIKKLLKYMESEGYRVMPIHKIDVPERSYPRKDYLQPAEVLKLVQAAKNSRDKAIIALLFGTGCRVGEALGLDRWDYEHAEVDKEGMHIIWVEGKGNKDRPLYLDDLTRDAIDLYLSERTDGRKPLFMSGQNRRITRSRVEQIVHEATRKAGLTKVVTPHTLRRSHAMDLEYNGARIEEIADILGHENISTTKRHYLPFDTRRSSEVHSKYRSKLV